MEDLAAKERRLKALKEKQELKDGLPFLFGWPWYTWAYRFFLSTDKVNLLCAANQISKSSTQIRKCIEWATNQKKWPELWTSKPTQFWYLYPSQKQVNAEFETKWSEFLPRGRFKDDPYYGWRVEKEKNDVTAIHFKSGVHVYFKTYAQSSAALQTGTCHALFADEECPMELFPELMFRITATNGYFHMVFTATLGQDFWRRAMEPEDGDDESLPHAFKQTVSLYDSQRYMDGSTSQWTNERIAQVIANCPTQAEVLKRVYGKFIVVGGRKYESFDIKRHVKPAHHLPKGWFIYGGADSGSGGQDNHPAALCYVAVRPDFRAGRVFLGWRGDGIETTSGDLVEKHISLKKENNFTCTAQYYDWADKDFSIVAGRMNELFEKADKSHDTGEGIVNTLFKNDMIYIYDHPELNKLVAELATLRKNTKKNKAMDDFSDAFRYAVTKIPWDFSVITGSYVVPDNEPVKTLNSREAEIDERRKRLVEDSDKAKKDIEAEFDEWNDAYG